MILSSFIIGLGFSWLLAETQFLTIRLETGKTPEPNIETPKRKHSPSFEPCTTTQVKTCKYPAILLLPEFCQQTRFMNEFKGSRYKPSWNNFGWNDPRGRTSYQQMIIGGHSITLKATSAKLYDTIAELQKVADGKDRKSPVKFAELTMNDLIEHVRTGSKKVQHGMRGRRKYYEYESTYETVFKDCLCGKEWLEAHYKDVIPEPTIDLIVDGIETHFNGNFKTGCIKELVKIKRSK